MLQIAHGWLMLDLTDSEFYVGVVGFASGLPILLVSIPAGTVVDHSDRRRMLIWFQATLAVLGVALCVMAATDITQRWHLLLAPFVNGSLIFMDNTTRQTIVADIDPRQSHPVEIALNSAGQNATQVVGPLVAGAIIGFAAIAGADALRLTCTQPPW